MTNLRYAIAIIGALSLLLGLSLGQNYYQHQRIEQLEFNRFREVPFNVYINPELDGCRHFLERAREEALWKRLDETEGRIRHYNLDLGRWETLPAEGLYIK